MPACCMVGTSGNCGERSVDVMAIARTLPAFASGAEVLKTSNIRSVWPPTRPISAGPLPLYGTWTMSTFASRLKYSPARCAALPLPNEP